MNLQNLGQGIKKEIKSMLLIEI